MFNAVTNLSIMNAPASGDAIIPKLNIVINHDPSPGVTGIDVELLNNLGRDGEGHPYTTPLLKAIIDALN